MIVKNVLKPKKTVAADDGMGDWEVVAKRESYLVQKPEDSDDEADDSSD